MNYAKSYIDMADVLTGKEMQNNERIVSLN